MSHIEREDVRSSEPNVFKGGTCRLRVLCTVEPHFSHQSFLTRPLSPSAFVFFAVMTLPSPGISSSRWGCGPSLKNLSTLHSNQDVLAYSDSGAVTATMTALSQCGVDNGKESDRMRGGGKIKDCLWSSGDLLDFNGAKLFFGWVPPTKNNIHGWILWQETARRMIRNWRNGKTRFLAWT